MGSFGSLDRPEPHGSSLFVPDDYPLDPHPPIKVVIVGAGLAGIITAILLSNKVPNLTYTIIDKRNRVGGTWAANIYPGVRCDVPSHCYQPTFAPNPQWSEYYSRGPEIRDYYDKLVDDYGLRPHIRLRQEVLRADWIGKDAVWDLLVKDLATGTLSHETTPFFINAQGRLCYPKMPAVPGLLTTYKGRVVHTGDWDPALDVRTDENGNVVEDPLSDKRVAVIGNGASGQQILPQLAARPVAHVDHYVRSRVWIAPAFAAHLTPATAANPGAHQYTDAEKAAFAADPAAYLAYRRPLEAGLHGKFQRNVRGHPASEALRRACVETMRARVQGSEDWLARLVPADFGPGCKRLTPAPGYLEAIVGEGSKVTYIGEDTPLVRATETGLVTADGVERPVDVVVAATGFENGYVPYFPTVGRGGVDLHEDWAPDGATGYPATYFGVMAADMPNYFFVLQAQSNGNGGSIPLQCELSATYIAKVLRKMQLQQYRSLVPRADAVEDFNAYCLGFFQDKVVTDPCSSWLKAPPPTRKAPTVKATALATEQNPEPGTEQATMHVNGESSQPNSKENGSLDGTNEAAGPGTASLKAATTPPSLSPLEGGRALVWWPGSGHHRIQVCLEPRWEDFEFERPLHSSAQRNRYHYFGNGWTRREEVGGALPLTSYLQEVGRIDLRSLHELWFE